MIPEMGPAHFWDSIDMNEKLREVFAQSLGIALQQVTDELTYATIPEWDSVAHMALVSAIEEAFDVMLSAEEVIDISSFSKAQEIVERYVPPKTKQ